MERRGGEGEGLAIYPHMQRLLKTKLLTLHTHGGYKIYRKCSISYQITRFRKTKDKVRKEQSLGVCLVQLNRAIKEILSFTQPLLLSNCFNQ